MTCHQSFFPSKQKTIHKAKGPSHLVQPIPRGHFPFELPHSVNFYPPANLGTQLNYSSPKSPNPPLFFFIRPPNSGPRFRQSNPVHSIWAPFLLCRCLHLPVFFPNPFKFSFKTQKRPNPCPPSDSMIPIPFLAIFLLLPSLLFGAENAPESGGSASHEQAQEVEKRMLSYADLMNNFGGPSSLDFFGAPANSPLFMLDEERPKREEGDEEMQLSLWKRSPYVRGFMNGAPRNYLMKKDEFVAPGVLRFGKRMPGVLRFGKRDPIHEKKAVPGVLRFGKREAPEGAVPGVLRFGKRMPQVLRFG